LKEGRKEGTSLKEGRDGRTEGRKDGRTEGRKDGCMMEDRIFKVFE
jgi:hypothetical protein